MDPLHLLWIRASQPSLPDRSALDPSQGLRVTVANVETALGALTKNADVILASFPLEGWRPEDLLCRLLQENCSAPVIIQDPNACTTDAVRLAQLGAFQCLGPEVSPGDLAAHIRAAADSLRTSEPSDAEAGAGAALGIIGDSPSMREVIQLVDLIGPKRCTVLITGETGTGKEVVARGLHAAGPRRANPMVAINCTAVPESLLEAELFGHARGAFTGAVSARAGRFEQADKGTLFLDEIGDMPLELQGKLLRVLQEREFQRLGSSETIRVDIRVIAASNVDLQERVRQGRFREDLYYRLNVVPIHIPPLRQRTGDIPALVAHFVERACLSEGIPVKRLGMGVVERLCSHAWPGNVRELENAVERAVILSGTRPVLFPRDFVMRSAVLRKPVAAPCFGAPAIPENGLDFEHLVGEYERALLEAALKRAGGNKTLAADLLRIKRTTFLAKMKMAESRREPALRSEEYATPLRA